MCAAASYVIDNQTGCRRQAMVAKPLDDGARSTPPVTDDEAAPIFQRLPNILICRRCRCPRRLAFIIPAQPDVATFLQSWADNNTIPISPRRRRRRRRLLRHHHHIVISSS